MFGYIVAGVALIGTAIAAYEDLKTTEVPDKIPFVMMISALLLWLYQSVVLSDFTPLFESVKVGVLYLLFGFGLYYLGQWGGGDAKILGAVGFLLPALPSEFSASISLQYPLAYLINLFFVGSIYMIVYSLAITLLNPNVASEFFSETKGQYKQVATELVVSLVVVTAAPLLALNALGLPFTAFYSLAPSIAALAIGFMFLVRFLKVVERVAFKRKIPVNKLQEGDMIGEDINELHLKSKLIRGLTKREIKGIQEIRKEVWIKEGVRFVPAFPLSILLTLFYGDIMLVLSVIL